MQSFDILIFFLVLGGCTILILFIVGWITRYIISQDMLKNIETFKRLLAMESAQALEAFKTSLQQQKTLMADNLLNTLAKLHGLLVDLGKAGRDFAASVGRESYGASQSKAQATAELILQFIELYSKSSIFFSDRLSKHLNAFIAETANPVAALLANPRRELTHEEKLAEMAEAWRSFEDKIPLLMGEMKKEYRKSTTPANDMWDK